MILALWTIYKPKIWIDVRSQFYDNTREFAELSDKKGKI